jgi:hypothetical protein
LLCVVHKTKVVAFLAENPNIMTDYYSGIDATELKRRPDMAKAAFIEIREKTSAEILEFAKKHELAHVCVSELIT